MNLITSIRNIYGHGVVKQLREWEKLAKSRARHRCSLVFSLRCKQEHLTPKFLRLRTALKRTKNTQQILDTTSRKLLKENINILTNKIKHLQTKEEEARTRFEDSVRENIAAEQPLPSPVGAERPSPWEVIDLTRKWIERRKEAEHARCTKRQVNKLERLKNEKIGKNTVNSSQNHDDKWVKNLSKYQLSDVERNVLSRGLKFAKTPENPQLMTT